MFSIPPVGRCLLAALLPLLTACTVTPNASPDAGYARGYVAAGETLGLRTDSLVVSVDSLNYAFSVRYAQLTGASPTVSAATVAVVNAAARASAQALGCRFGPTETLGAEECAPQPITAIGEGSPFDIFLGSDVLSAPVSIHTYMGGGNSFVVPINTDLRTGAAIRLADLFRPGAPYADTLSAQTERAAVRRMVRKAGIASRTEARAKLYPEGYAPAPVPATAFSLGRDSLALYVAPYRVAGYTFGPTGVQIAYRDLSPLLRTDGAAARLQGAR